MRCPECNRKMKRFLYGFKQKCVDYCRRCKKIFEIRIEIIEPHKCVKCGNPILWEKAIYMANAKVRHRRCPKKGG